MDARPSPLSLKKVGSGRSEVSTVSGLLGLGGGEDQRSSLPSPSSSASSSMFEYFGWVYHLGVNSIGHEYCHLRFLFIRGKYVEMYKRDPHENPGIKPIRRGVVGPTLMLEEVGRRKVYYGDVYVLRFFNRLEESKKGEIACATAGEAQKWLEAFDQAKQQGQLMQMTMMSTPNINKELHYLNKEDRLLRWLLVKHRETKYGQEFLSEEDSKTEFNKFQRSSIYGMDEDEDEDEDDDDDDEEYDAEQEGKRT